MKLSARAVLVESSVSDMIRTIGVGVVSSSNADEARYCKMADRKDCSVLEDREKVFGNSSISKSCFFSPDSLPSSRLAVA